MLNLSIALERYRDCALLELHGELDRIGASLFCDRVCEQLQGGVCRFIVDLRNLDFVDSQGIHALTTALRVAQERRGDMYLVLGNERIARILSTAGLEGVFASYDHRAAALVALA